MQSYAHIFMSVKTATDKPLISGGVSFVSDVYMA